MFEQNGDNQIYQLNKIARPVEDQDFQYLYNEPQFLLDQIVVSESGVWTCLDTLGTIYPLEMFVGINQLTTNSNWHVYPNPAKEFVNLSSSQTGNITCQIYNYSGILMEEQTLNKTEEEIFISLDGFSSGVYLVKLIQNDQTEVLKFVKE
mgnify:CR=1 FL=1